MSSIISEAGNELDGKEKKKFEQIMRYAVSMYPCGFFKSFLKKKIVFTLNVS